ncbi:hypothetical protein [Spirosoma pulveris]
MFNFNTGKFDFWPIYDAIKRFYPIGIPWQGEEGHMFLSYPGLKELETILVDNLHNETHFTERWSNFAAGIQRETGKEVIGTTHAMAPSFSSFVLLEKTSVDNLTRTKELHFFVSLIGPFYTVIGQDASRVLLDGKYHYGGTNYLVVSPENEFADVFRLLCNKIEARFNSYRFVPFEICRQTINGLSVRYSDEKLDAIFPALFNNSLNLNTRSRLGNDFYKSADWIKEGWEGSDGGWVIYPPLGK